MPSWHCSRIRRGAARVGERARHLRLADARLALQQQRLLERGGEEHGGGEPPVGEVALPYEGLLYVLRGCQARR